jgi:hypothetical protein
MRLQAKRNNSVLQKITAQLAMAPDSRSNAASMSTAIMGDAAAAVRCQKRHLVFKGVGAQRPAMAEDARLPSAPILVVNFCPVLGGDGVHVLFYNNSLYFNFQFQAACFSALLLELIIAISSFHAFTNDFAPSS